MTREEIGSYLGLKLETVSRAFSHFQNEGMISVHGKDIEIKAIETHPRHAGPGRLTPAHSPQTATNEPTVPLQKLDRVSLR